MEGTMNTDYYITAIQFDVSNLINCLIDRMNGYDNDRTEMCQTAIGRTLCYVVRKWLNDPKRHQGKYNCYLAYYACRALLEYGFQPVTNEQVYNMTYNYPEDELSIRVDADVEWGNPATYMRPYYKITSVANKLGKECYKILSVDPSWQGYCPVMKGLIPVEI